MTAVRTPVETLRAAADRLEALDKAATPGPWTVVEDYDDLVLATDDALDPDGDGLCGSYRCTDRVAEHDFTIYDEDSKEERQVRATFGLIAALRPAAGPLAASLRESAEELVTYRDAKDVPEDHAARMWRKELAVARAILGEQP